MAKKTAKKKDTTKWRYAVGDFAKSRAYDRAYRYRQGGYRTKVVYNKATGFWEVYIADKKKKK